jgi:RNA polymerase sigma-70 factor, ECF subfamily
MDEPTWLAERFEENRPHLRSVAYRMLGSLSDADDAVQEAWQRLHRSDTSDVENLPGWLTTVVARVSLNMLRSRRSRREEPLEVRVPDPIVTPESGADPEGEAVLADSVGLALLVVLDTLTPAERLSFVLHDMFAATRQLASRARRRVQGRAPVPDPDLGRQRRVVDAFFAAARDGDFDGLVAVLDPDVVLRADGGDAPTRPTVLLRGARTVAENSSAARKLARFVRPALVNGAAGAVVPINGRLFAVMGFTVADGRIVAIDILYDPQRLAGLDLTLLDG